MQISAFKLCFFIITIIVATISLSTFFHGLLSLKQSNNKEISSFIPFYYKTKKNTKQCMKDKIEFILDENDSISNIYVVTKVLEFMLRNVSADDHEFIEFVRTLIRQPSKTFLNLDNMSLGDYSQFGQSVVMDKKLNFKRNGFFIEAGAYDGELSSNSLFFERQRNWTGILIEPIPSQYNKLLLKNRNVYTINACIAGTKPFIGKLLNAGGFSGRLSAMSNYHKTRYNYKNMKKSHVYVPCIPLYTILKAINVLHVDYFSLDVEGAEWDIIRDIPFDKIQIDSFTIEWSAVPKTKDLIKKKLIENGLEIFEENDLDLFFIKKKHNFFNFTK